MGSGADFSTKPWAPASSTSERIPGFAYFVLNKLYKSYICNRVIYLDKTLSISPVRLYVVFFQPDVFYLSSKIFTVTLISIE